MSSNMTIFMCSAAQWPCVCVVQKKSRMKILVTKLRDRVANLHVKIDQLEVDKETLRFTVSCYHSSSTAANCGFVA